MIFSSTNLMLYAPVKVLVRGLNNLHITQDLKKITFGNIMERYVFKNQLEITLMFSPKQFHKCSSLAICAHNLMRKNV